MQAAVSLPRLVVVTRKTPLEQLRARHGTKGQAAFYVKSRGQSIGTFEEGHARLEDGLASVLRQLPGDRRRARVDREELNRFVFEPEDIVIVVGQDGLVANVAKYLDGQRVLGVNPDPARYDGVLCRIAPDGLGAALSWSTSTQGQAAGATHHRFREEARTMAVVEREDGQRLYALNEVFIGHRTHQSARYVLTAGGVEERQSSSGIICCTGTGATGWARSIVRQRGLEDVLPAPTERSLAWMVREPFPSVNTGTNQEFGRLGEDETLHVLSEMGEDGVIFADGIEDDRIEFLSGQTAKVRLADRPLRLVIPPARQRPTRLPPRGG